MIQIITRYGNLLLLAMGQTLLLALCGLFFACILGMFFGLLSVLKNKACRIISSIFVDVIRGVPMIVLAYFIYFGVPYFPLTGSTRRIYLHTESLFLVCSSILVKSRNICFPSAAIVSIQASILAIRIYDGLLV